MGLSLRFIELMPVGGGSVRDQKMMIPGRDVEARIETRFPLVPACDSDPRSPAKIFSYADGRGEVGFSNPVTEPFCIACDRVRITADGKIRNCLFDREELDLRDRLRAGAPAEEPERIWRTAVWNKGLGGCLEMQAGAAVSSERDV